MLSHNRVTDFLPRAHGFANRGNVRVVPRVVIHQRRTVGHASNLVAVIPPAHDLGCWVGVLSKPVVCLAVVINDVLRAVWKLTGQHDGG